MLKHGDLKYVTKPLLEVGMFHPKSGTDKEVVVVSFYIDEREVLNDVVTFFNYTAVKNIIDVTYSKHIDEDGFYTVYIEMSISKNSFQDVMRILYDLMKSSDLDEWEVKIYKKKPYTLNCETVEGFFTEDKKALEIKGEKKE